MCQIFVRTDPGLYRSRSRSMRLRGVSTSIRLEKLFWRLLEEIGARDGLSVPQLVAKLYDELSGADDGGSEAHANFTSFLRVCCTRYLALQVGGAIPAAHRVPITTPETSADRRAGLVKVPAGGPTDRPVRATSAH